METSEMRQAIIDAIEKDELSKRDLMDVRAVNKIIAGTAKEETIKLAFSRLEEAKTSHKAKNPKKLRAGKAKSKGDEQLNKVEQIRDEQLNKNDEQNENGKLNKNNEQNENGKLSDKVEQRKVEQLNKEISLDFLDRFKDLEIEVKKLKEENEEIRAMLKQQKETKNKSDEQLNKVEQHRENVLGFSIRIENTWTQGKVYGKYYAIKRIAGKHHRIYLGKDASDAENKIKAYCEKHSLFSVL